MKVGVLIASVSRNAGGLFDAVRSLAQALHAPPRLEIQVFGLEDENTCRDLAGWGTLQVNVFRVLGPSFFGYSPDLVPALLAADLDMLNIHGTWMYPSLVGLQWSRRSRNPYLVTPHGMLDPWALRNSRWKKLLASTLYENAHLRKAACLHALCESEAQAIRSYGLRNPICVIPNGIHLPNLTVASSSPWESIVPCGAKVLLYLGRLHPKKGLLNLLRAWGLASRQAMYRAEEWHLVIAGWDQRDHEKELKSLCQQLGIQKGVHFVGPQFGANKCAAYHRADAFILPSLSEGLPMVVLEAWAYGLPVLMTPQCNLPEGFQARAALPVDPNCESIARGLEVLFSMFDSERQALGMRGRQLVEQRFSWTRIAADMLEVYEWVLGGGRIPRCVTVD